MKGVPHYGQLKDVNTTDIRTAIELGCQTMQQMFNADDDGMPYMRGRARPDPELSMSTGYDGHLPGRHLNALLNAEAVSGIELNPETMENHRRVSAFVYSGPVPLPMGRHRIGGPLISIGGHNLREGFHALNALVAYRSDDEARKTAEASIQAIFDYWSPQTDWDTDYLEDTLGLHIEDKSGNITRTLARAIGPLVKYYRTTRYGPALELAIILKEKLVAENFLEDGSYNIERMSNHGHSIACDLSSLAQLADLTRDTPLMNRVKNFYDRGMWDLRDETGWVIEKTGQDAIDPPYSRRPDFGEINNTGDLVETALILGQWGHSEYFEDAERMVRCHLLPTQLRDTDFMEPTPNPSHVDGKRDVARRMRGGWGFPAPYGHEPVELTRLDAVFFHMDIVGGAVGSLCEVLRSATLYDVSGHHVNLLFDHETEAIKVDSNYTHEALTVTLKKPGPLRIRIPSWAPQKEISISGNRSIPRFIGSYLFLAQHPANTPLQLKYEFPEREIALKHRTRNIRVRLKGDGVVAMDNFGADLTYFPPFEDHAGAIG